MAPNRFRRDQREKREVTPFTDDKVVSQIPPEWRDLEAPINFTWVVQDELAGMGWPKSRDQLRFLISQGIDHLVTLSSDKLPPHYAFPDLKWTLIPVEDFTGPTISEIKKFISIIDEARRNGEGVGVHCAEGRGRTGVMCACYLIYYHDIAPWDAIRIMRRQRPGSVERKVQEETVVKFYNLLNDYGKNSLDDLEAREKQLREMMQKRQLQALQYDSSLLLSHTSQFYGTQQNSEQKAKRLERFERMRRAKSMPKMDAEEEQQENAGAFQNHVQSFFNGDQRSRSQPRPEKQERKQEPDESRQRAVTPGRSLLGELSNLKPVKPRRSAAAVDTESKACDFTKHFKDFMTTPTSVKILKRNRSFSRTRDKDSNKEDEHEQAARSSEEEEKGVGDSTESEKDVARAEQKKIPSSKEDQISRSTSPDRSRSESGKESGSEATSSFSSQTTVEVDCRKRYSHLANPELTPDLEMVFPTKKSSTESNHSTATLRYSRRTPSTDFDKTLKSDFDYSPSIGIGIGIDIDRRRHSAPGGSPERDSQQQQQHQPPPPTYKPKCTVDTSTTYSYYTRIRSRADEARRREQTSESVGLAETILPQVNVISSPVINARTFNTRRARAATIERDMQVTVTVTETPTATTHSETTSWRSRIYGEVNKETSYYPVRRRRVQSPETEKQPEIPPVTTNRTSRSHYRRTNSGPLPELNNNNEEERLKDCCRKISADGATSSLNGYRDSLLGSSTLTRSHNESKTDDYMSKYQDRFRSASKHEDQSYPQPNGVRCRERAKSEGKALYDDEEDPNAASSSGGKENHFMAAAKKWASYDKPTTNYTTPLSRDGWKRNYRKFNYSRFLNTTRETYV